MQFTDPSLSESSLVRCCGSNVKECDKLFGEFRDFLCHVIEQHKGENRAIKFVCCDSEYSTFDRGWLSHRIEAHPGGDDPLPCIKHDCGKRFPSLDLLRKHVKRQHCQHRQRRNRRETRRVANPTMTSGPPESTNRSNFDDMRDRYLQEIREALQRSKHAIQQTIDKFSDLDESSRLRQELPHYLGILESAILPRCLSYAEYSNMSEHPRDAILLATMEEAALVLKKGPLKIPIIVPSRIHRDSPSVTADSQEIIEEFINMHIPRSFMVQDYGKPTGEDDVRPMKKEDFKKALFDPQRYPTNCLDITGTPPNSVPSCYLDVPSLQLLAKAATGIHGGKKHTAQESDLGASQYFSLLAGDGAWSMPHIDRCGVLTSIKCITGEKLWIMWPGLSIAQLEACDWQKSYAASPCIRPVATLVTPHYQLLQPSGTLHAVFTLLLALAYGTMHWDSRDFDRIMELINLETNHRTVTNEDPPQDLNFILRRIMLLMWQNPEVARGYEWPSAEGKRRAQALFNARNIRGCTCSGRCTGCICQSNGLSCILQCHKGNENPNCTNRY